MSIKYPIPINYSVQQSQIRYTYKKPHSIKHKTLQYLKLYKHLNQVHKIKSDLTIDIFDYFKNIIKKWDEKSKEINGWTSCYLTIKIVSGILNGLKRKYGYTTKYIVFSNIEKIYQITNTQNMKIFPINNLIFGLLIAIKDHQEVLHFYELQQIVEVMAQRQVLYHIANYKSRGKRTYQLPWERIDDPIMNYRKKFAKKRNNTIKIRKNLNLDSKQNKIDFFFTKQNSNENEQSVLSDGDDEILEILEELDNET